MGEQKAGVKADEEPLQVSALATQSDYTPVAQSIKNKTPRTPRASPTTRARCSSARKRRSRASTSVKVWGCALQCYDAKFLSEGGADVDGQYSSLFFVPFEEAKQNKSVNAFLKNDRWPVQGRRLRRPVVGGGSLLP